MALKKNSNFLHGADFLLSDNAIAFIKSKDLLTFYTRFWPNDRQFILQKYLEDTSASATPRDTKRNSIRQDIIIIIIC